MDIETRLDIIKSQPFEEVITEAELRTLLETKARPKHYIGIEISGVPHIGHLLFMGKKVNDFSSAGVDAQIYLADWHTMANNKFGGDWKKILKAAEFYKKLFGLFCPKAKIVLGSELYHNNDDYWKMIIQFARRTTMARATRTLMIMGRSEKDTLHVSQYIYPIMQAADIAALDADIPHAGMDQRRIHVLAKELFHDLKMRTIVPVHHHLMPGLGEPPKMVEGPKEEVVAAMKMSKSKPGSAITVLASDSEITKAIRGAWCPERVVEENPVLLLCKYVLIPIKKSLGVERKREYGGDVEFTSYEELEKIYAAGKLHPMDLKAAVTKSLISILGPVRDKFTAKDVEVFKEEGLI